MCKKVKCNVCNHSFMVEKEKIKVVSELVGIITKYYNAVDCPKCGCQKVLWPRLTEVKK